MSQELLYTSAPRGLKSGSRGFCTVACTQGMSPLVMDRLESLSGYREVFGPHDPQAASNPVCLSHVRLSVGGQSLSLLSRIAAYGADYTDRTNKLAHHVVLDPAEQPAGGPAWLAGQPAFLRTNWDGQVTWLPPGKSVPRGDGPPAPCALWRDLTGDAGWAGVLVEAFLADPNRPAYLVYSLGQEPLGLLEEAIALLPSAQRWSVTFSTYFTGLPQDVHCAWRCVLKDSPDAKSAARVPGTLIIDLTSRQPPATGGTYVQAARTGKPPMGMPAPPPVAPPPIQPPRSFTPAPVKPRARVEVIPDEYARPDEYRLADDEYRPAAAGAAPGPPPPPPRRARKRPETERASNGPVVIGGIAVVAVFIGIVSAVAWFRSSGTPDPVAAPPPPGDPPGQHMAAVDQPLPPNEFGHPDETPRTPPELGLRNTKPEQPHQEPAEDPKPGPAQHALPMPAESVKPMVDPPVEPVPGESERPNPKVPKAQKRGPKPGTRYVMLPPPSPDEMEVASIDVGTLESARIVSRVQGDLRLESKASPEELTVLLVNQTLGQSDELGTFRLKENSLRFQWKSVVFAPEAISLLQTSVLSIPAKGKERLNLALLEPLEFPEFNLKKMAEARSDAKLTPANLKVSDEIAKTLLHTLFNRSAPVRTVLRFEETILDGNKYVTRVRTDAFENTVDVSKVERDRVFELSSTTLGPHLTYRPMNPPPGMPLPKNVLSLEKPPTGAHEAQWIEVPGLKLVLRIVGAGNDADLREVKLELQVPRQGQETSSTGDNAYISRSTLAALDKSLEKLKSEPKDLNLQNTAARVKQLVKILDSDATASALFVEELEGIRLERIRFGKPVEPDDKADSEKAQKKPE